MGVDNKNENGKSRMVAADVLRCVACYLVHINSFFDE